MTTPLSRLTAALEPWFDETAMHASLVRTNDLAAVLAVVEAAQRAVKGWYQEPEVGDFDRDIFDPMRAALARVTEEQP